MAKQLDNLILRLHELWHGIRKEAARRKPDILTLRLREQAVERYNLPAQLAEELLMPAGYLFAGVREEDLNNSVSCQIYNVGRHVGSITYTRTKKGVDAIIQAFEPMSEPEAGAEPVYLTDLARSR